LWIENFAIVDQLEVPLVPGLNVLTGETGAGKSIVVDSINAVVGERADVTNVRSGAKGLRVCAEVDVSHAETAKAGCADLGVEPDDGGTVILDRSVSEAGRSTCRVNGRPATVTMLRELGEYLVDIHGQHAHQTLLRPGTHMSFLDEHGGGAIGGLAQEFAAAYADLRSLLERRDALRIDERELRQREELLRFQVGDIDAAGVSPAEEADLQARRSRLAHAEKLFEAASMACTRLSGEADEGGAGVLLGQAVHGLREAQRFDPGLAQWVEALEQALIQVEESGRSLAEYREGVEFDPAGLDACETRLRAMADLQRKYGDTVADVLAFRDRAAAELEQIEHTDEALSEAEARIAKLTEKMGRLADRLSQARVRAARELEKRMVETLDALGMPNAVFRVGFEWVEDEEGLPCKRGRLAYSATGVDRVRFLISTNPGEEPRPLAKVASGGEISRTMLALKCVVASVSHPPVVVFDEIDSGLSSGAAQVVGEHLLRLSCRCQVLCVTHSPFIAALAHGHHAVTKEESGKRNVVRVCRLEEEARVTELTRMLGGDGDGTAADHASELAARGRSLRSELPAP